MKFTLIFDNDAREEKALLNTLGWQGNILLPLLGKENCSPLAGHVSPPEACSHYRNNSVLWPTGLVDHTHLPLLCFFWGSCS